ncbi:MAG: hypothetical protein QW480_01795 [Candidatus Aenigmatarchaeota archaeon]
MVAILVEEFVRDKDDWMDIKLLYRALIFIIILAIFIVIISMIVSATNGFDLSKFFG